MSQKEYKKLLSATNGDHIVAGVLMGIIASGKSKESALRILDNWYINMERLKEEYDSGESRSLIEAIQICWNLGNFPHPDWVKEAWNTSLSKYSEHEVQTLDEASGIPVKQKRLLAGRKKSLWSGYIYFSINKSLKEGIPVNDLLFNKVADNINSFLDDRPNLLSSHGHVKTSWVKDTYYETKDSFSRGY